MWVRKILFWCGAAVFVVGVFVVGTISYIYTTANNFASAVSSKADCAVVFGAAVYPGGVASGALYERTYTAVQLYKNGSVTCLVLSGADSAYNAHEVDVMRDIALANEVPPEVLEFDHDGQNTRTTLMHLNPERSYVLVSNDFHLPRINLLAQKVGLKKYTLMPSVYLNGRYTRETSFVFREAVALWYYAVAYNL